MNSCYRQVGNAVPVLFAQRLGEKLAEISRLSGVAASEVA
jgi:site-specific DNA-cytosine methylase